MPNLPLILIGMISNLPESRSLIDSNSKPFSGELREGSIKCKDTIVRHGQLFNSTFFDDNLYKYTSHVSIASQPAFVRSKFTMETSEQYLKLAEPDSGVSIFDILPVNGSRYSRIGQIKYMLNQTISIQIFKGCL